MDLVDEEDDLPFALRHLADDRLESFFEFALVLGSCDQCSHVEGIDLLATEVLGHVASDDTVGQAFGDSGLTDAWLTDEDRVVLGASGEDLQYSADLFITADDGVELPFTGSLTQVDRILAKRIVLLLGVL